MHKEILQIEHLTASQLFQKLDELKGNTTPADEAAIISKYWPFVTLKEAANIIGCSTATLRNICFDHPDLLRPVNGKYPTKKVFEVKNTGWKNLRP